ncbi:alpha/beta hydrolase [Hyalangium rubrum]|uniref:Alpha/beta hydrolase n=1 Tax=Hyalangium rubrum TaxID=3103134 RepID=A0ABU5HG66_9BACT|nr:alpha/beta hydrolase [Hyalangium sp. s54d21]MDY7232460.1 alpha/beta hydrolase [Hyalangium sp. s54d21]
MNHREDAFEGAGGIRLFSQLWRPEGKPRAVLAIVHGFGEHSGRYLNIARRYVPLGYAVHAFDLRGHGRSPGQRGHVNAWAEYREDLQAFLAYSAKKAPGCPVFLFGHSLGSLIALDYVLHHPEGVQGLILSGTAVDPVAVAKPLLVAIARFLSRFWPSFRLKVKLDPGALSRLPNIAGEYLSDPLVHGDASARWGTEALGAIAWVKAHASELKLPLLVLHGEADRLNSLAGAQQVFDAAGSSEKRLALLPGGFHEPHNDSGREKIFMVLEEFLGARLAAAAA